MSVLLDVALPGKKITKPRFMAFKINNERVQRWLASLKNRYRFVVMNDETFEEVSSYKLTLLNLYVFGSTLFVVLTMLGVFLVAFTPLKRYLPGMGVTADSRQLFELTSELKQMERDFKAQQTLIENLQRRISGNPLREEDVPKIENNTQGKDKKKISASETDYQLRKEVELELIGAIAQKGRSNAMAVRSNVPPENLYFVAPVNGEISEGFDASKMHYGVDVLVPKNTAIKAAMEGYVFMSDWTLETGNTIGIQHDNNLVTFYKHNSSLLKKTGSFVRAGEAIAIVGNTGTLSHGPHLHFELWYRGKPTDPTDYITF